MQRSFAFDERSVVHDVLRYDPGHPLLPLALARFETRTPRADFLRNYALDHLPSDLMLWTRAAEMLLDRKAPMPAARALPRLAALDAAAAAALEPRLRALESVPSVPASFEAMKKFVLLHGTTTAPITRWHREGKEWIETHASGATDTYVIAGPQEIEDHPGTLLYGKSEPDHLLFISDPTSPNRAMLIRGGEATGWAYLGEMIEIE